MNLEMNKSQAREGSLLSQGFTIQDQYVWVRSNLKRSLELGLTQRVRQVLGSVLNLGEVSIHTVTGQNGTGQNGTDKMVRTKWYTDKMVWDKMVWTKWYGQNGTDKMVVIFRIDYNSSEFNSYLVTKSHSEMINIQRRPKRLKVEAGLMKKSCCQWEWN